MQSQSQGKSKVYFKRLTDWTVPEDTGEALFSLWNSLPTHGLINRNEFVAIKLTFGEEGTSGFIKPAWLLKLVNHLKQITENLFIIETNTLYRKKRANAVGHLQVASMHGFNMQTLGIPVIIGDGIRGLDTKNINIRGEHLETAKIARGVCDSDIIICLSHITGHCQTGFAGALKNLGMGCAGRAGKLIQHSNTLPEVTVEKCTGCGECMEICPTNAIGLKRKKAILVKERCIGCGECTVVCRSDAIKIKYDENVVKLQEKMVEYTLGVKKAVKGKIVCLNLMYNVTKNCDCMAGEGETNLVSDAGIVGGVDPVAVDKAALDIIGPDTFKRIYPEIDPLIQITHAEKIRLGTAEYELIEV